MPYFTIVELYVNRCCRKRRNYGGHSWRQKWWPRRNTWERHPWSWTRSRCQNGQAQDVKEKSYRWRGISVGKKVFAQQLVMNATLTHSHSPSSLLNGAWPLQNLNPNQVFILSGMTLKITFNLPYLYRIG